MLAVLPPSHDLSFKGLHCHNSLVKIVTESKPVARFLLTEQEVCNILETQWYQAFQAFICGRDRNQMRALFTSATFSGAPLQSRTVGFPESGFDLGSLFYKSSQCYLGLNDSSHIHP